jgi:hypothetical protein
MKTAPDSAVTRMSHRNAGGACDHCVSSEQKGGIGSSPLATVQLPCGWPREVYRWPEAAMMIRKRKNDSGVDDKQRKPHSRQKAESDACELQDRITDLKNVSQEQLADATFMLFMVAKQQTEQARHAIDQHAKVQFAFDPPPNGDLADYLSREMVTVLRHYVTDAPSLLESLSGRSRDARFTVCEEKAVLMLAAVIREQRLDGILEGLRLAGLLTKPSKNRHAGSASQGQ